MGRDDGFEKELNKLISDLNLNKYVTNIGFKIGKEKNSVIKESNICVQVSRYEQGAGAPFEAVLIGTPIILSDHSGSAEDAKRYDAGYFSKFNDKIDLSNKMNFILQNPEEAMLKTKNASQKIKLNLGIEVVIKNYQKIYFESNVKK
jgi:glycosyltransferase involved in cell wall biosynthesis